MSNWDRNILLFVIMAIFLFVGRVVLANKISSTLVANKYTASSSYLNEADASEIKSLEDQVLQGKSVKKSQNPTTSSNLSGKKNKTDKFTSINSMKEISRYLPYLQIGGFRYFGIDEAKEAIGTDLFLPVWQTPEQLIFTDVRFYDRSGKPFEGNLHLGYRKLLSNNQQMFGVYGSFDRKRSGFGNYFNQLTFGGEYWLNNWFIGGNVYCPIGSKEEKFYIGPTSIEVNRSGTYKNIWLVRDLTSEKALPGVDAQLGYAISQNLIGYLGGYYFKASEVSTVAGPKARLQYDFYLDQGKRMLGIFDKIGVEAGIQNDKPRGTTCFLSANFRIGLWPTNGRPALTQMERHMVDIVRRDVDVVTNTSKNQEKIIYRNAKGEPYKIREVKDSKDYQLAKNDFAADALHFVGEANNNELINQAVKDNSRLNGKAIIVLQQNTDDAHAIFRSIATEKVRIDKAVAMQRVLEKNRIRKEMWQ